LFDLGLDYLQRYPSIIRAITAEQILDAVQKYAQAEHYALSIAGPVDSSQ
jgi:zinc protease